MGRSRYLRAVHPGPAGGLDPEAPEALLECLTGVSERIGRPAVLLAMDDLSAIAVSRVAPMLHERFRIPRQPDDLPARVADKAELAGLCARWDVPHPETVIPASAAEAAEAARRLGLPVVAKWSRPWLLPAGADGLRSTTLLYTAADARRLYERSAEAGSPLLLQRFLPAGPDTDWFFHGAFARGGRPLLAGSGRKELSWPVRTGLTAVGRWLPDPAVEEAGLRLAERLGYHGILDLDFRRDEQGVFRLVDFNPRPGAQFRLFTDAAGMDVVQALYLDLTGQRVPEPVGGPGRVFLAENYALLAAVRGGRLPRRRAGDRTPVPTGPAVTARADAAADPAPPTGAVQGPGPGPAPAGPARAGAAATGSAATAPAATGPAAAGPASSGRAVRSPAPRDRGQVELAWFAADDPLPFLAMLGALLGRGFGKGARVLRGVPAQGRRTALAAVRAPRQRGRDEPQPAALSRRVPPEAPAEPDELVTR
ncbi:ATP-grasp domain-containing protein [Streptomyces sp. NPDC016562]|uniref:carboxylate--amine ligase n=1 Tax=Streptomyces sp. NPDC016562 TaxID=3364966 RepID=UPI0036FF578E